MEKNSPNQRIAGLDGLRAIAIISVLLFHSSLGWAQGGYLGVDLFFVISGFLITSILVNEIQESGRLDYRRFYVRRAKRLLPAVCLLIPSVILCSAWLAPQAMQRLHGDAIAGLLFLINWHLIFDQVSYFESFGTPPLLKHLWSLAIEEQFYIVWAFALGIGAKFLGRAHLALMTAVLALISVAWMAEVTAQIGYPLKNSNASRMYFGTDTHVFPLLMGAVLGFLWQPQKYPSPDHASPDRYLGRALSAIGVLGIFFFFFLVWALGEQTTWLYPWGFLLSSLLTLIIIVAASDPTSPLGKWLDCAPLRWIGERSYGIYLWHWPIFVLFPIESRWQPVWHILLTCLVAAISYHLVENPIRHGLIENTLARLRARNMHTHPGVPQDMPALWQPVGIAALYAALSVSSLWVMHSYRPQEMHPLPRSASVRNGAFAAPHDVPEKAIALSNKENLAHSPPPESLLEKCCQMESSLPSPMLARQLPKALPETQQSLSPSPASVQTTSVNAPAFTEYEGHQVTAVGDSVLLGASHVLKKELPGIEVHATQGWQAADLIRKIKELKTAGRLREVVIIHLGTNGYVYAAQLENIMALLQDRRRVIIIDSQVPRRWMQPNNTMLKKRLPEYPNAVLVSWSSSSEGQDAYFINDKVHLTRLGQRAYTRVIIEQGGLRTTPKTSSPGKIPERKSDPPPAAG